MARKSPFTWGPKAIFDVTNTGNENILLELGSGQLRLDAGRTLRLTGPTLEVPQLAALIKTGVVKVQKSRVKH